MTSWRFECVPLVIWPEYFIYHQ